jgi:hypothetical protein
MRHHRLCWRQILLGGGLVSLTIFRFSAAASELIARDDFKNPSQDQEVPLHNRLAENGGSLWLADAALTEGVRVKASEQGDFGADFKLDQSLLCEKASIPESEVHVTVERASFRFFLIGDFCLKQVEIFRA